jgi:transposase InsO family protein
LTDSARFSLAQLSRWFDWKSALVIVKPDTLVRWHRQGFRLLWRHKSRPGRHPLARELRALVVQLVKENPTWGQRRVADELSLKLGIKISPRTARKYWPGDPAPHGRKRVSSQRWATFVRNHASAIVTCDFMVAVTAKFELLYIFVVLELGSRRILECNVTSHPTAEWTLQQLRHGLPGDREYRFLMHDRDSIFSAELDQELKQNFRLRVLRTPAHAPVANAYCERVIGSLRRECLDFIIPVHEAHLRKTVREWVRHYNGGRPHSSLGPGIPDQAAGVQETPGAATWLPGGKVISRAVLGGLHHEYALQQEAA